ncbi:hypothetical protein [Mycobacterium sp. ACS4331]|uniref:hypothetical protein n=1 Tax=Mycobacterium sp. ACS4331 TaxID=1834121 RepID=UPI0007FBE10F|nr:hypothetical protein [Mycobacterium sp. ACS4331]OBF14479.1 hypothetical protein A5727_15630 [Mycobacterium sp. ACS4331]
MPTAMDAGPVNPIEVFSPVVQATIQDLTLATMDVIADPMPITRQLISNSVYFTGGLAYATVEAGATLSSIVWDLPATLSSARDLVRSGDVEGAIAALEDGTIGRALQAADRLIRTGQQIMRMQADILGRLSEAVPEAARAILAASANAVREITRAQITAFVGVVEAVKSRDLTATYNAVVTGAANVADVTRAVTIGTSSREADEAAKMELKARSILGTVRTAQRSIAEALKPGPVKTPDEPAEMVKADRAALVDDAAVTGKADSVTTDSVKATTTKAKPGAALRQAAKSVRTEIKAAVAKVKKALSPKAKKALAPTAQKTAATE